MSEEEIEKLTNLINGVYKAVDQSMVGPVIDKHDRVNVIPGNIVINLVMVEASKIREKWQE